MNEESLIERRSSWGFAYKIKPSRASAPQHPTSPITKRIKLSEGTHPPDINHIESKLDETLREALEQTSQKKEESVSPTPQRQPFFQSFFDKYAALEPEEVKLTPGPVLEEIAPLMAADTVIESDTRPEPSLSPYSEPRRKSQVFFNEEPGPTRNDIEQQLSAIRQSALQTVTQPHFLSLTDPEPYTYRRSSLNKEVSNSAHKQPSFENFVRIFNHFCAAELANLRGQSLANCQIITWLSERVSSFLRDNFEARIVEAERADQVVQVRPNMKNVFNRERLEVLCQMVSTFQQALATLTRFEQVMGHEAVQLSSGSPNIKFRIFKALNHARKMSRYLNHHSTVIAEIEEARRCAMRPRLQSFEEGSARLEETTALFHGLVSQLENCERQNAYNTELVCSRVLDPLWAVIDCPAMEICRLFLL